MAPVKHKQPGPRVKGPKRARAPRLVKRGDVGPTSDDVSPDDEMQ